MAETRVTIDRSTLFDNIGDRQLEFSGEAGGERFEFAVQHDVIEALSGRIPGEDTHALALAQIDAIEAAAARALARFPATGRVIVSGNDLDQPWPADRPHQLQE